MKFLSPGVEEGAGNAGGLTLHVGLFSSSGNQIRVRAAALWVWGGLRVFPWCNIGVSVLKTPRELWRGACT